MTDLDKRIDEIMGLKPCPFCGSKPFFGLSKRGSCQLHGEPFQAVTIFCKKHECPTKPFMKAGDIYNGGEQRAKEEAAKLWNTRAFSVVEHNLKAENAIIKEGFEHLQAQVVERDRVIRELANLSGQLHALVTCTEFSESFRVYEANIVQSQIKVLINKAGE